MLAWRGPRTLTSSCRCTLIGTERNWSSISRIRETVLTGNNSWLWTRSARFIQMDEASRWPGKLPSTLFSIAAVAMRSRFGYRLRECWEQRLAQQRWWRALRALDVARAVAMERPPHLAVPLNILLVEDAAAERVLLESYLKGLGHNVQTAHNGGQAVQLFDEDRVDLVLMDVVMPVVDGIRATREIKAKCAKQWVPVILLSALGAQTDQAHGLEAGADDYLPKPVNLQLLDAKLRSFQRIVQTTRLLARKREEAEAEMALATALMERLVLRQHALSDPALTWVVHPSSRFSGDVVAAARSPSGRLIAMLADA